MSSSNHRVYQNGVQLWIHHHRCEPGIAAELMRYAKAAVVLWHLDLEPARPILMQGYAANPRGSRPRDPIVMLRSFLLAVFLGYGNPNPWVEALKSSRVLRMLIGLTESQDKGPAVGTHYDWMHRLQDGALRRPCRHDKRPSDDERQRSRLPKAPKRRKPPRVKETKAQRRRREKSAAKNERVTERLVSCLKSSQTTPNPNDLWSRLSLMLLYVAVTPSARRGLLGDGQRLVVAGDGSALSTGGSRHGKRTCRCPKRARCDCERIFSDPDADIGYDSHRDLYYYGHMLTEFVVSTKGGHDLPLALRLDPASTSEFVTCLTGIEQLRKQLREHTPELKLAALIYDAGVDGIEVYRFLLHHDLTPIIPLSVKAPAVHPNHRSIHLSDRGVPLCPGLKEMIRIGRSGSHNQVFGCPVKANRHARCPRAGEHPDYRCQPLSRSGPTATVNTIKNPRLCPPIPRNHPEYRRLINLRSGCERSFSVKKERFKLQQARHRRRSFWLIRAHLIALLQHAMAWVAHEDEAALLDRLLGRLPTCAVA
jgi:hypothetical protein